MVRMITNIAPNDELITDCAIPLGTKLISGSKPMYTEIATIDKTTIFLTLLASVKDFDIS